MTTSVDFVDPQKGQLESKIQEDIFQNSELTSTISYDQNLPLDSTINYSTDMFGNILPSQSIFDGEELCFLLRKKIHLPKEQWLKRVKDGLLVYFSDDNPEIGKTIPTYLSITDCIDIVALMIQNTLGFYPPAGKNLPEPPYNVLQKRIPSVDEMEFFSWSMEILCVLQQCCPKNQKLLPQSPITRVIIRCITTKIMNESMAWIEKAAVSGRMDDLRGQQLALKSYIHSCGLLNQFLEGDLEASGEFVKKVNDSHPNQSVPPPNYSYLWIDKLHLPCYASRHLSWLTQSVILALRHPIPEKQNEGIDDFMDIDLESSTKELLALDYWKCVEEAATIFFYCCFVDQFIKNLVTDPHCEQLLLAAENILRIPTTTQIHINKAKYRFLRLLVALAENEEPYFLDFASKMKASYNVAQLVAREASYISKHVATVFVEEDPNNPSPAIVAREALRVVELLSYDSNFVKLVTENLTMFILEYLSVPAEVFSSYFDVPHSFPHYITALIFRLIANLHCYNPSVSPPDQKHFLINKIHHYFTTIFVVNEGGELCRTSRIVIGNIATNLWVLFQQVTESFSFTLQELELWRSFMGELQKQIDLVFPPVVSTRSQGKEQPSAPPPPQKPAAPRRPVKDEEYITDSDIDDEELEDDADEFVLAPAVKPLPTLVESLPDSPSAPNINLNGPCTTILKGFFVCFGVVPDPEGLKALVQQHGGTVIGYVTKSVTHVVCGHDAASVEASASKIQSAATKQVPCVSEKLIHDSIARGHLLDEKPYLVASHSYLRRVVYR